MQRLHHIRNEIKKKLKKQSKEKKIQSAMQCPFAFLGLETTATIQEIDKKYKQMMLKSHPDKSSICDIVSDQHAKMLNEAREKAKELSIETTKQKAQQFWRDIDRSDEEKYALAVENFMMDPSIQEILDNICGGEEEADKTQAICAPGARIVGHCYGGWCPLFADLMKIGATTRQPYMRISELSNFAGVPEPFQLIASVATTNPFALEREIHEHFASVRKYGRKKEFFLLSKSSLIDHFQTLTERAMLLPLADPNSTKKRKHSKVPGKDDTWKRRGKNESAHFESEESNEKNTARKHRKAFASAEEETAFKQSLKMFIQDHFQSTSDTKQFISKRYIKIKFDLKWKNDGNINPITDNLFFKELGRQMASTKFLDTIASERRANITGYAGLVFRL